MEERPLGCWESGFRFAHDMLSGTMLVVGMADFMGEYNPILITETLSTLFSKHPLLQATIEIRGLNAFFIRNSNFDDIPITFSVNNDTWKTIFNAELHRPLETDKYLWRLVILEGERGFKIILTTHHAIADAISQTYFIEQFGNIYNTYLRGKNVCEQTLPFLSNIETYLAKNPSWDEFAAIYNEHVNESIDRIPYEVPESIENRQTISEFMTIDGDCLQKINERCRTNGVTINSFLNAVLLQSQLQLQAHLQNACLKTPVNLRKYCQPIIGDQHIGCQLAIVDTMHQLQKESIWKTAKDYQNKLYSAIPKLGFLPKKINYNEVDLALVSKLFAVENARRRKTLPNTFGISNIGRIKIQTQFEKCFINHYSFNTNHLVGNYYMFISALTLHEQLHLTFAYVSPLVSAASAQRLIKTFMGVIKNNIY